MKIRQSIVALGLAGVLVLSGCGKDEPQLVEVSDVKLGVETVEELVEEPFAIRTEVDATLKDGEHKIVQQGERGQIKVTYEITKDANGLETSRKEIKRETVKAPVDAIVKVAKNATAKGSAGEIIGYSDPASANAEQKEAPTSTSTNRDVVDQILSHRNELEKDGDSKRTQSSTGSTKKPNSSSSSSGSTGASTTEAPKVETTKPATEAPSRPVETDPDDIYVPADPPSEGGGDVVVPDDPEEDDPEVPNLVVVPDPGDGADGGDGGDAGDLVVPAD
ncbi:MAG: G5 domain-containing protein [Peptoniphilaceae bacterium]|nr:G5 domain-containing protein [Peptoniphilaceae bacterium]MDY6085696.1 G5 domain-containing protein [Peptoniphilaceae bacterium]